MLKFVNDKEVKYSQLPITLCLISMRRAKMWRIVNCVIFECILLPSFVMSGDMRQICPLCRCQKELTYDLFYLNLGYLFLLKLEAYWLCEWTNVNQRYFYRFLYNSKRINISSSTNDNISNPCCAICNN